MGGEAGGVRPINDGPCDKFDTFCPPYLATRLRMLVCSVVRLTAVPLTKKGEMRRSCSIDVNVQEAKTRTRTTTTAWTTTRRERRKRQCWRFEGAGGSEERAITCLV
eukprot:753743-Hanusia_phi.AAC.3